MTVCASSQRVKSLIQCTVAETIECARGARVLAEASGMRSFCIKRNKHPDLQEMLKLMSKHAPSLQSSPPESRALQSAKCQSKREQVMIGRKL
jgi:hypothetical protein